MKKTAVRRKQSNLASRAVRELRRIIRKTQAQFASMVGVVPDTIVSVENARNALSEKLARRIKIATGADDSELMKGKVLSSVRYRVEKKADKVYAVGCDYTKQDFAWWRKNFETTEANALARFNGSKGWIELVFRAAGRPGMGGNRDRLPGFWLSLTEWLEQARRDFKLGPEIDAILKEAARRAKTKTPDVALDDLEFEYRWDPLHPAPPL